MKFTSILTTSALLLGSLISPAATKGWLTDFEEAKQRATKEKKYLLVNFSGSDWCHYCIKLDEEFLSKKEFQDFTKEHFIPVILDFPNKTKLPEALAKQNNTLKDTYKIQGFPTLLLMNEDGLPFARTGYEADTSVDQYVQMLTSLKTKGDQINASLKEASTKQQLEKAKILVEALKAVSPDLMQHYSMYEKEISTLDPEDKIGFQAERKKEVELNQFLESIYKMWQAQELAPSLEKLNEYEASHSLSDDHKQVILLHKGNVHYFLQEFDQCSKILADTIAINPDNEHAQTAREIKKSLISSGAIKEPAN